MTDPLEIETLTRHLGNTRILIVPADEQLSAALGAVWNDIPSADRQVSLITGDSMRGTLCPTLSLPCAGAPWMDRPWGL